jgi:hypothetical protein
MCTALLLPPHLCAPTAARCVCACRDACCARLRAVVCFCKRGALCALARMPACRRCCLLGTHSRWAGVQALQGQQICQFTAAFAARMRVRQVCALACGGRCCLRVCRCGMHECACTATALVALQAPCAGSQHSVGCAPLLLVAPVAVCGMPRALIQCWHRSVRVGGSVTWLVR